MICILHNPLFHSICFSLKTGHFFSVHSSILKKEHKFFENPSLPLSSMLQCACACLVMPEVASVKHAAGFIANFFIVSRESQYCVGIANEIGEAVFRQVSFVNFAS
jgi:hypothetical protein